MDGDLSSKASSLFSKKTLFSSRCTNTTDLGQSFGSVRHRYSSEMPTSNGTGASKNSIMLSGSTGIEQP